MDANELMLLSIIKSLIATTKTLLAGVLHTVEENHP